jgi:hypothetical protein
MRASVSTSLISPFGRLLQAKDPVQLLEETLAELESDASVPPEKGQALRRLASFLLYAEAKRIQALEAGQTPPSAVTTSEDSFVLNRARELAAILSKRSEELRFCFAPPRPRIPADPITTVEDVPVEVVDTIDLVATFQAILDRFRARDAPRNASGSQSQ